MTTFALIVLALGNVLLAAFMIVDQCRIRGLQNAIDFYKRLHASAQKDIYKYIDRLRQATDRLNRIKDIASQ